MSAVQLEVAAAILGPLLEEVVFVGGATVHLWITDPGAPPVRATDDVDVICEIASRIDYYRLGERLRARGLQEAVGEPVICRWRSVEPRLVPDVMPTDPRILGFSRRVARRPAGGLLRLRRRRRARWLRTDGQRTGEAAHPPGRHDRRPVTGAGKQTLWVKQPRETEQRRACRQGDRRGERRLDEKSLDGSS